MSANPNIPSFKLDTGGFKHTNRASTAPVYEPSKPDIPLPAELQVPEIETAPPSRDTIIAAGSVPESMPVLLGVRARLAEKRLERSQKKIEAQAEKVEMRKFIGESIIKGKSYMVPGAALRPTTRRDRARAAWVEKRNFRRQRRAGIAANIAIPYHKRRKDPATGEVLIGRPDFKQAGQPLSRRERRYNNKNARAYKKLNKQIGRRDKTFSHAIQGPYNKASRAANKRDHLILRVESLERAKEASSQRWADRRQAAKQKLSAAGANIAEGSRKAAAVSKKASKATYNVAKKATVTTAKITKKATVKTARVTKKAAVHTGEFVGPRMQGGGWAELAEKALPDEVRSGLPEHNPHMRNNRR